MKFVIGISGLAGDGKDSVSAILREYIASNYPHVNFWRVALADKLKAECQMACLDIYGIDPLNCSREEKEIIRDILVFHGKMKRIETMGTYWTNKVQTEIDRKHSLYPGDSVFCVPDIRYSEYANDEVAWIKSQENGFMIHIKKYKTTFCEQTGKITKEYSKPINREETINCPSTESSADFIIEWEDKSPTKPEDDVDCVSAVHYVAERIFSSLKETKWLKQSNSNP